MQTALLMTVSFPSVRFSYKKKGKIGIKARDQGPNARHFKPAQKGHPKPVKNWPKMSFQCQIHY
jgi:hypothetical protein